MLQDNEVRIPGAEKNALSEPMNTKRHADLAVEREPSAAGKLHAYMGYCDPVTLSLMRNQFIGRWVRKRIPFRPQPASNMFSA
eukprot:1883418-Pyramimonas_sp.AAC.1